ncbi:hypothetical protein [uncultured Prevotella sp.]|uniref:hypothetical protein n=2 Tax=uncultured Prevotella sp. TaxID=159272 RepID=UPI0027E2430B|nr:hypothetical protein [uncultured Prevotella sp.]
MAYGRRRNLFNGNMGMALSYMFDAERLDAGKYYISVQAIDAGGLGGVWSDECVYEHKQTAPSTAQLPVNITAADTLQLRVNNPRSDAKYSWNVENGTIISQSNNGSTAQAILHAAGNLKVSVAMELGGQTYKSKEKTLSVLPFAEIFDSTDLDFRFQNVFDATVNDKGNGKLSISWSTSGEKTIDMIADSCTFSTIVKVYAPEDFALAIPSKVMKDTPISVKRPKTMFDNDISYFNVKGVTKSQTTNDGFILTLGDAGYNEVVSSVGFNDGSECTFVNKTTVTEETMPDAIITGVLADGNHYRVNWNTSVPQMVDRVEILRETNRYNEFEVVATMPVSQGSWLDTASDNRIQTQRYRIRLLANNNVQTSTISETHKPLHVTIYKSATKGYSLVWNAYEGMDIESYRILRGTSTDNLTQIAEVAGSLQNYTDISAPAGTCLYAIAYVPASTQQLAESCAMRSNTSNAYMLSNAVSTAEAIEAVAATSIEIGILEKYDSKTLYGGDCRFHLTATMLPTNASLSGVKWSIVSGDNIAHLSADGVLTHKSLGDGDVVVRAEATDGSGIYGEKTISISQIKARRYLSSDKH